MVDEAQRIKWIDACSGYGYDDDLGAGQDLTTEECRACKDSDPQRFAGCSAEIAEAQQKLKEKNMAENETSKVTEATPAATPEVPAVLTAPAVKEKKPVKPRGASQVTVLFNVLRATTEAISPQVAAEMTDAITGGKFRSQYVRTYLEFGVLLGAIEKQGKLYKLKS